MEKVGCVSVTEGKEVRRDDSVKYFLPTRVGCTFWVSERVMSIEVI